MSLRYLARRLASTLVQLLGITVAVFILLRLLPTDPVSRLVGSFASEEIRQQTRAQLHLDEPILTQLGLYLGVISEDGSTGLLQGNLGESWVSGESVAGDIARTLPITLEWITLSFVAATLLAIPLGLLAASRPRSALGRAVFGFSLFAGAQAGFWWGLMFVYVFFFILGVAPAPLGHFDPLTLAPPRVTGLVTVDALLAGRLDAFAEALHHLMLPVATLAFVLLGPVIRMVHQHAADVLRSDFVLYGRACGLPARTMAAYTLRNAFAPALTLLGILYGFMLSGAVTIEKVFSLGGIGEYAVDSVLSFDYPAVQATVLVVTGTAVLIYLLLDLAHAALDPRIAR